MKTTATTATTATAIEHAIAASTDSALASMFATTFESRGMRVAAAALRAHSDFLMATAVGDTRAAKLAAAIRDDEVSSLG